MRRIINFLLTLCILWLGSHYFSSNISIDSTQTLIIASIAIFGMNILFGLIVGASALLTPILIGCLPLLMSFIIAPFLTIIELFVLNNYLIGFHIYGIWTYILLCIIMFIFSIEIKTKSN